ncbi:MAG: hypothetical protein BHW39_11730 [Firmicutes bacterium CAG:552_39_19]|nr:MAG: hypothetical protein BHW39_11730 [Firmicutes bacterium CAG:552_39_19]
MRTLKIKKALFFTDCVRKTFAQSVFLCYNILVDYAPVRIRFLFRRENSQLLCGRNGVEVGEE